MADIKKKQYSWEDYHTTVWQLAQAIDKLPNRHKLRGLIPISRGGLIPGVLLSHYLSLPIKDVLLVRSYNGFQQEDVVIENMLRLGYPEIEDYLFVDDIIDSGRTLLEIQRRYPLAQFVASIGKVNGVNELQKALPVHPPVIIYDNAWIEFPWEVSL